MQEEQRLNIQSEYKYNQDKTTQVKWREIGALGKIHNIAMWLRASTERYQAFLKLAKKMLSRDNDTRWNSWLTMLGSAIELENAIRVFINKNYNDLHKNELSRDKWETIHKTIAILKPFKDATKSMEGDQTTFNEVLQSMDFLIKHIKSKQEEYAFNQNLSASLLTMWFAFNKYYNLTDQNPAYTAALLLNPTLQKQYLDDHWKPLELCNPGTIN